MSIWITKQFKSGQLKAAPVNLVDFANWKQALKLAQTNSGGKQVLVMPGAPKNAL